MIFIIGLPGLFAEKAQLPAYPSLWESFDEDFQNTVIIALQNEFRGKYRQAVENKKFRFGEDCIKVTCSLGFHLEKVSGRDFNQKLSDMISQASRALYLANDNGGNRTESLL